MSAPDAVMSRQNAKLAVLVLVPVLIIAAMAIRTVVLDRAAAESMAAKAFHEVLKAHAARLGAGIERFAADNLKIVSRYLAASDDPVMALRGIMHESSPAFAALFDDTGRIFPPEDDTAQLWQERRALSHLNPAVASASKLTDANGTGIAWGRLGDGATLVACEKSVASRTLCIAATQDEFRPVLERVFAKASEDLPYPVLLIDPWGSQQWPLEQATTQEPVTTHDLGNPLKGWKLRASVSATSGNAVLAIPAMVGLITAGWGVALVLLLRQQVEAARQYRTRAESAARLSHDLRTPIANLEIYVDLVGRHGRENESIRRCCEALQEEIARLAIIAERTLQRSRGKAPPASQGPLVSVDGVLGNLTVRYASLMASAGCSLAFEPGAPSALVDDQTSLERIVINLFDNARLHAKGSRVTIATRQESDCIVLTICDDGERRVSQTTGNSERAGLGLKVVEEIALSRRGAFRASIDKAGSRFEISLPSKGAIEP